MRPIRTSTGAALPPDPVIEAYKEGIDRTLIRENLRRSVEERVSNLQALVELAEEARRAGHADRLIADGTPPAGLPARMLTPWEDDMATCETCGNEYDKTFEVRMNGESHTFDSFECAIQSLAPRCARCGTRIIGHGLESKGTFYCCDHCAEESGITELRDRV